MRIVIKKVKHFLGRDSRQIARGLKAAERRAVGIRIEHWLDYINGLCNESNGLVVAKSLSHTFQAKLGFFKIKFPLIPITIYKLVSILPKFSNSIISFGNKSVYFFLFERVLGRHFRFFARTPFTLL